MLGKQAGYRLVFLLLEKLFLLHLLSHLVHFLPRRISGWCFMNSLPGETAPLHKTKPLEP